MREKKLETEAALLSELLLYRAVLGRGFNSPFPMAKGLVFSSATPGNSIKNLLNAEARFRSFHEAQCAEKRARLAALEAELKRERGEPDPKLAREVGELREELSGIQNVTWKEDQVAKSSLVELLHKSHYGALSYIDPVGARLSASMSSPLRLATDLSWVTLTADSSDEALVRANATGGALIHSLTGADVRFNYFCNCHHETATKLLHRVTSTTSGRVIAGHAVILPAARQPAAPVLPGGKVITEDILFGLLQKIFFRGKSEPSERVDVPFHTECRKKWEEFLEWDFDALADRPLTDWQRGHLLNAPANPQTCAVFGSYAALTFAFLEREVNPSQGVLRGVELNENHYQLAVRMARCIFEISSGLHKLESRARNAEVAREELKSGKRLVEARKALLAALEDSEQGKVSRTSLRNLKGVTLGLVDELVKRGDIQELVGTEECKMGRTTRAYTLPGLGSRMSSEEAVAEFAEASENLQNNPDLVLATDVHAAYGTLQRKAAAMDAEEFMPVVPLSAMSADELRALPKVLETYSTAVCLRGRDTDTPEPEGLLEDDDDNPLDVDGMNLWFRYRPGGETFREWSTAAKLGFTDLWEDKPKGTIIVPA